MLKKEETKKEKEAKKPAGKRPRPAYQSYSQFQSVPMQVAMPPSQMWQPQGYQQAGPSQLSQRIPKSHLRCLNCGELGHFAKECSKSSQK